MASKESSLPETRTKSKTQTLRRPNTSTSKAGRQNTPPSLGQENGPKSNKKEKINKQKEHLRSGHEVE